MSCHHIPSVRCPECADNRPSMGYWPTPCGTCAALREENARLIALNDVAERKLGEIRDTMAVLTRERDEAREQCATMLENLAYADRKVEAAEAERDEARAKLSKVIALHYEVVRALREENARLEDKLARCVEHWADTEARSAEAHAVYQQEAHRRGDVRHYDAYDDLPEATKEWDRVLVRWVHATCAALAAAKGE